jgi:hypothetical protein
MYQTLSVQAAYLCSQYAEWGTSQRNGTVAVTCAQVASLLRRKIEEADGSGRKLGKSLREVRTIADDFSRGLPDPNKRAVYAGLKLRLDKILGKQKTDWEARQEQAERDTWNAVNP